MIEALRTGDNQAFATLIKVTPHLNFFSKGTCYYGKEAPYRSSGRNLGTSFFFSGPPFKKKDEKHRYLVLIFHLFQRSDENFVNLISCSAM